MNFRRTSSFSRRPRHCRIAVCALAANVLLCASFCAAQNLVVNPGFESGTTGWSGFGATLTAPTTLPHTGSRSGYVTGRTATWNGVSQSFLGVLQTNVPYGISAWVRLASGSNQPVKLTIKQIDGNGTNYHNVANGTATSTNWTQLNGSFTLTTSGTLTTLLFYVEGPAAGVNFYADDFDVEVPATGPVGEIDANITHQTIAGFGGAIAFYNNWLTTHPYKQEMYTDMFQGLNLGILRIGDWFRYQGTVNFDPSTAEIVSNANRILGHPVAIEMSSWSPPGFLKSNGTTTNGGTLVMTNGGFAYSQFADYWYDSLMGYRTNGIVPTWISIQNEPDWSVSYDSCVFHPTEDTVNGTNYPSYAKALDAVYQRLSSMPSPPKLLGPEVVGIGYNDVENYAAYMNSNSFYGVAHHLYHGGSADSADSFIPNLESLTNVFPDKPKFMTEYGRTDMLQTALLINNCMTFENASAYIFWSLDWPYFGLGLVQQENPWYPNSWTNAPPGTPEPHGYWLAPQYYAMKHFSYFITNGFKRVDTPGNNPNLRLSAYLSPDGRRLVEVMINPNSIAYALTNTINGFTIGSSMVYQTVGTNAQVSQFADLGSAPANLQWSLPGYSITTVVFDAPAIVGPASNPDPTSGAYNVGYTPTLSWLAGSNATAHRVYFGYSSNAVVTATTNSLEYQGSFTSVGFAPGTLAPSGRFYWRVDELAGTNVTTGPTWTFATAANPSAPPQVTSVQAGANQVDISFASYLGQTYRIERSDSLNPAVWTPVADNVVGTGNTIQISDAAAPLPAQRFYRLVLLPP